MPDSHSITFLDYSNEKSTVAFFLPTRTAGNFTAQETAIADVGAAVAALSIGAVDSSRSTIEVTNVGATPPTDGNAQRERKWLILYKDTVNGQTYQMEIPCAKLVGAGAVSLLASQSDQANLSATEWTDFITAFETNAKSPYGNAVSFLSARLVGRNI